MEFFNEFDIMQAQQRLRPDSVSGRAVAFLAAFRDEVNNYSDGWAHWKAPLSAAQKLITVVKSGNAATEAQFKAALTPIRSFYTKRGYAAGMSFPDVKVGN